MSTLSLRPRNGESASMVVERVTSAAKEETVGQRIKRLRIVCGLSQREMGDKGISYAYISRIEAGTRDPSAKALIKIADKLNESHKLPFIVSALYLTTGEFDCPCQFCGRSA